MPATQAAPTTKWAREYETIYILRPTTSTASAEVVADRSRDVIKRLNGKLTKVNNWGKRLLAYPIQRHNRGIFVHLVYVGYSDLVAELERNLKLVDDVIRYQTILVREDVDPSSVDVDDEEVQFLHVDDDSDEPEVDPLRQLGLDADPEPPRRSQPPPRPPAEAEAEAEGADVGKSEAEGADVGKSEAEAADVGKSEAGGEGESVGGDADEQPAESEATEGEKE